MHSACAGDTGLTGIFMNKGVCVFLYSAPLSMIFPAIFIFAFTRICIHGQSPIILILTRSFFNRGREKIFIIPMRHIFHYGKNTRLDERLLMPKLNEISGEIKALEAKIESVDSKVEVRIDAVEKEVASLRSETLTELEVADAKVESLRNETKGAIESLEKVTISRFEAVDRRFKSLEAKLPVMEKMAELEARLAELLKRKVSA